jgi:hypothetical protein
MLVEDAVLKERVIRSPCAALKNGHREFNSLQTPGRLYRE